MKIVGIALLFLALDSGAVLYQICEESPVVLWTVFNDVEDQWIGQVYTLPGTYGLIENIWVRTRPLKLNTEFAYLNTEIRVYKYLGFPASLSYYSVYQVPWSTTPTWHEFPIHYQWQTSWSTQIMVCAVSEVKYSGEPVNWNRLSFAGDGSLTSPNPNWWYNQTSTQAQWQLSPSFGDWNFRLEYNENVPVEPESLGRIKSNYR
jgi:hypothetical protein